MSTWLLSRMNKGIEMEFTDKEEVVIEVGGGGGG